MTIPFQGLIRADAGEVFIFVLLAIGFSLVKAVAQAAKSKKVRPAPPEVIAAPPALPSAPPQLPPRRAVAGRLTQTLRTAMARLKTPSPAPAPGRQAARRRPAAARKPAEVAPPMAVPASWRAPSLTMPVIGLTGGSRVKTSIFPSLTGLLARRERHASATGRWLRQPHRLRTAMLAREILGPPRGLPPA